ncbi:MAG: hypothetical protein IPL61_26810 [Myxococcales bacterium]|nr:hypothetical protein [Myxococcales bacterium]
MRTVLPAALALAVLACGGVDPVPAVDATNPDAAVDAPVDAPAPTCDVSGIPAYVPMPIVEQTVLPSLTAQGGEVINDTLQGTLKRHYLVVPGAGQPRPDKVFLWLAGSGAEPHQFTNILTIAASAGYVGISLAYDNETQVAQLCSSATVPACNSRMNLECGDQVRRELIYGRDVSDTPCIDVPRPDSIEHRVIRLVQYLDANFPSVGVRQFLNAAGDGLAWDRWAIGGWSQGGGHAGVLAGDHLVARALYMSKAGDSVLCPLTSADPDRDCDVDGDGLFDPTNEDELMVPAPASLRPRLTPGGRQFGAIHEREGAWNYSRETFEAFGMGAKADAVRVDGLGPYPAAYADLQCAHVFSTDAAPNSDPNDFHISMAIDAAMARDANGDLVLAPMIRYALGVPVP